MTKLASFQTTTNDAGSEAAPRPLLLLRAPFHAMPAGGLVASREQLRRVGLQQLLRYAADRLPTIPAAFARPAAALLLLQLLLAEIT